MRTNSTAVPAPVFATVLGTKDTLKRLPKMMPGYGGRAVRLCQVLLFGVEFLRTNEVDKWLGGSLRSLLLIL